MSPAWIGLAVFTCCVAAVLAMHPTAAEDAFQLLQDKLFAFIEFCEWCFSLVVGAVFRRHGGGKHRPGPGRYLASDRQHVKEAMHA